MNPDRLKNVDTIVDQLMWEGVDMDTAYIAFAIAILVIVALLVYFTARNQKMARLSPLAGLAFGFILAGLIFGENRWFGYGLLGIGLVLAVIDMIQKWKKK
jgi:hypothetical protein